MTVRPVTHIGQTTDVVPVINTDCAPAPEEEVEARGRHRADVHSSARIGAAAALTVVLAALLVLDVAVPDYDINPSDGTFADGRHRKLHAAPCPDWGKRARLGDWARYWGTIHETGSPPTTKRGRIDRTVDLHNNYVGRLLGSHLGEMGAFKPREAMKLCTGAWNRGYLWVYAYGAIRWSDGRVVDRPYDHWSP